MASELLIREAREGDLPGIFAIYDREVLHGTATFQTEVSTPSQRSDWWSAHRNPRYPALVAEIGGSIVGWATLSQWSPRRAYDRTAEDSVYVAPEHHRRGVARALLRELLARARHNGVAVVLARTCEESVASIALHESLGFVTIGTMRRVGEKFGRLLDVRVLQLELDR